MNQKYKIDRINKITYKGQRKKKINSMRCRYIAKSHIVNCDGASSNNKYINYRGSQISKVNFCNAIFYGCDFWGVTFNKCSFRNATFTDCVFMACKFKNCDFENAKINYTIIVNTNLNGCNGISITDTMTIIKQYPVEVISEQLMAALLALRDNKNLKKNKILFIGEGRINYLNLYLLRKKYSEETLIDFFTLLKTRSNKDITTYKRLESILYKMKKDGIL